MTKSDKPVVVTRITGPVVTAEQRRLCDRPVAIPKQRLSEQTVTSLWGKDRKALAVCANRHESVVGALP